MSISILPDYPDMTIEMIAGDTCPIQIVLTSQVTTAKCPRCGSPTNRTRGTYQRRPQEVPLGAASVVIELTVHKFCCPVS